MTTVLVVDDEPEFAWVVAAMLEAEGYEVCVAENGRVAMLLLQGRPIHFVLSDIHMPVLDGIALRKQVHQAGMGSIPFAFMSSIPPRTAERLVGRDPWLQKPFTMEALTGLVRGLVAPA